MAAIAEALVATAVGLLIAIPAVAMYNFYQRLSKSILANTNALSHVLLSYLVAPPAPVAKIVTKAGAREERRKRQAQAERS